MPTGANPGHGGCDEPPPRLLVRGIAEFNRGAFFEQHETLEALWRAEARPVRGLYQGILQIGVAFYHLDRGNFHGAVTMLDRGARHLRRLPPRCHGVDVAALIADAASALDALTALGPEHMVGFDRSLVPTIRLASRPGPPRA